MILQFLKFGQIYKIEFKFRFRNFEVEVGILVSSISIYVREISRNVEIFF